MIHSFAYHGSQIPFHTSAIDTCENVFSIIVGKNGTGKSRILRSLVREFVQVPESRRHIDYLTQDVGDPDFALQYSGPPDRIIAISTSPFDRFPVSRFYGEYQGSYQYLGIRGLTGVNISVAYMSRILGSLIDAIMEDRSHAAAIADVLGYLGYHPVINIRLAFEFSMTVAEEAFSSENPIKYLSGQIRPGTRYQSLSYYFDGVEGSPEELRLNTAFRSTISKILGTTKKPRIDLRISPEGVFNLTTDDFVYGDISLLMEYGLVRLRDVSLVKKTVNGQFRITDASSGEQCVLISMLGIASKIRDNSLICIDEPEICLHPEWQEKYIKLLISSFKKFKSCHFVIATHSPQIVSRLEDDNCYVVDLQSKSTLDSSNVNHRSADFQLANVFRAPGFKNEYMLRELVSTLTSISAGNKIDRSQLERMHMFLTLKDDIDQNDPVRHLLDLLGKVIATAIV